MTIYVCNQNEQPFKGRYDGIDYVFAVGKTVAIPDMAAQHIFGYGLVDKQPTLVRWGLMKTSTDIDGALKWLGNFVFGEQPEPEVPDLSKLVSQPEPEVPGTVSAE